ncbi:MAG: aminoacyl-tRNA hydrolase [Rickettsiales bacterium]
MWLIVGLGNPGPEYANTRHNIGFMAVDALAGPERFTSKFHGEIAQHTIEDERVILLKPLTFMNRSGKSVQAAATFYKITPGNIIVLHDEIDLPLGKLRIKQGGGANGHNGLKDIDQTIGPDYWRIRMGVGRPEGEAPVHDYVLGRFTAEQRAEADKVNASIVKHMALFWQKAPETMATKIVHDLTPQRPKPPKPTDA